MNAPPGETPTAHLDDDEMLDLVSGFLDDAARERVIRHATACPACEARLREFAASHERALARAERELSALPAAPRPRRFATAPRLLALAAGFLVVTAAWYFARSRADAPSPTPREAETVWLPAAALEGSRRSGETSRAESLVVAGVQAYDRRDLAEAERLLRTPLEPGAIEWMRRLYLANALVAQGRDAEAIPLLDAEFADLVPEPWNAEWGWTYFVALDREGLRARADSVLEGLVRRPGNVGDRARAVRDGRRPPR